MASILQTLFGNLAAVALLISLWMHLHYRLYCLSKRQARIGFGFAMGLSAIASMAMSVEFQPGVYFDLRASLIAISGIFGGPIALFICAPMAVLSRVVLGGVGTEAGVTGILIVSAGSIAFHYLIRAKEKTPSIVLLTAVFVAGLSFAPLFLVHLPGARQEYLTINTVIASMNLLATAIGGAAVTYFHRFTMERDILRAALTQAPEYHYVKDLRSRFVVANLRVAEHHGRSKSSAMAGLTDLDLDPDRGPPLFDAEQNIMRTGRALVDIEEQIEFADGSKRIYSTTKVPLRNRHGDIIGLAGVTRDVTEQKQLEQQLMESRDMMSKAMAEMSDGLAMFDRDGLLVLCNEQYRSAFPRSAYARQPGTHIVEIIRASVRNAERKDVPSHASETWLQNAARELFADRDTEVPLYNDRWLSLRTRLGGDGSALVLISDITAMKQSELALKELAAQMKGLAEVDALTGIANRRIFEEAIASECSRSKRTGAPLSLLLIDVDRFKNYNDTYGHQAGDQCLRDVGQCLRSAVRRPTDVVARYGGEEFAVLLPETDVAGALSIAGELSKRLQDLQILHQGSEYGIVTVSTGISTMAGAHPFLNPNELVAHADEALYQAKESGRNRAELKEPQTWAVLVEHQTSATPILAATNFTHIKGAETSNQHSKPAVVSKRTL